MRHFVQIPLRISASLLLLGCVTEHSAPPEIRLDLPEDAVRVVLAGTGFDRESLDLLGLPRRPASLCLLASDRSLVCDPYEGIGRDLDDMRGRRNLQVEAQPGALITRLDASILGGLLEMGRSSSPQEPLDLLGPKEHLQRALELLPDLADRCLPRPLEPGVPTPLLDPVEGALFRLPDGAGFALRLTGPHRAVLYLPRGHLPAEAGAVDDLLLGTDGAILDGSGLGRDSRAREDIDTAIRWGVPREGIRLTSIRDDRIPEDLVRYTAVDGFEFFL